LPELLLQVWKLVLLGFIYLFFLRVLRAMWANLRTTTMQTARPSAPPTRPPREQENNKSIKSLKVLEPENQKGTVYELADEITIGRAPGCRVNVDDTYVSQLHARVFRRDGRVLIEDLGSTNGTFCNGKKVSGSVALQKGDRVQVGRTVMEAMR